MHIYENAELVKLLVRMELGESIPEELYRTIAEKDITERGDDY